MLRSGELGIDASPTAVCSYPSCGPSGILVLIADAVDAMRDLVAQVTNVGEAEWMRGEDHSAN